MPVDETAVGIPGNPDILRIHIDRGLAFDKVAALDPAAAPLGTDDEAAGTPLEHFHVNWSCEGIRKAHEH